MLQHVSLTVAIRRMHRSASRALQPPSPSRDERVATSPLLPPELSMLQCASFAELVRSEAAPSRIFVVGRGTSARYLKMGAMLEAERRRLIWLKPRIAVPTVLAYVEGDPDHLLLTRLPGVPADIEANRASPATLVDMVAQAARTFHAVNVEDCPFDASPLGLLADAEARVIAGTVRQADLSTAYRSCTPEELLAEAQALASDEPALVVTHGDLSLPNVLIDDRRFGFVDVGSAGYGDRHRDLSLLDRSIAKNLGKRWRGSVYEAYGIQRDPQCERFYLVLDQLLMARATRAR